MTAQLFQTFPLRHSRLLAMGGWKNSEESLKANARNFIWPRELVLEIDIGVNISVTPSGRLMMTTIWSWFLLNSQPTISYPSMGILISSFYMLYNVVIRKFIQIIQKSPLINIKSDS